MVSTLEYSLTVPQNVEPKITIRPSSSTPRSIPKRNEIHTKTCIQMLIAALLTVAKKVETAQMIINQMING